MWWEFFFLGEHKEIWHETFDMTYVRLFLKELVDENEEGILSYNSGAYQSLTVLALQKALKKIEELENKINELENK